MIKKKLIFLSFDDLNNILSLMYDRLICILIINQLTNFIFKMKHINLRYENSEEAILACILIEPQFYHDVTWYIDYKDFENKDHQIIFKMLHKFLHFNRCIDPIILLDHLNKFFYHEHSIKSTLLNLFQIAPNILNKHEYLKNLIKKKQIKHLLKANQESIQWLNEGIELKEVIKKLQDAIKMILSIEEWWSSIYVIKDLIKTNIDQLKTDLNYKRYIKTNFNNLNMIFKGFKGGELTILAGWPGVGKTCLSLNFALDIAKQNKHVLFFSIEMDPLILSLRCLSKESGLILDASNINHLDFKQQIQLETSKSIIDDLKLYVIDCPNIDLYKFENHVKNFIDLRALTIDLIIIDYIQIFKLQTKRFTNKLDQRHYEIGEICNSLKQISRTYNVPILILSQLSWEFIKFGSKPSLIFLKSSGCIEESADNVIYLSNYQKKDTPYEQKESTHYKDHRIINLHIVKQRNGALGCVQLNYITNQHRFDEKINARFDV